MTDPLITDGRMARRERNRTAVLDAVLELFGEDATNPKPEEVAARSGVSLRSVYRYFDDRESLLRSAMEHHFARIRPLFRLEVGPDDSLDARIDGLVAQRSKLYEAAAPVFRATIIRSHGSPILAERVRERRDGLARQAHDLFAVEIEAAGARGPAVDAAIDVLTEFEAFDHLRRHRAMSVTDAEAVVATALRSLFIPV